MKLEEIAVEVEYLIAKVLDTFPEDSMAYKTAAHLEAKLATAREEV